MARKTEKFMVTSRKPIAAKDPKWDIKTSRKPKLIRHEQGDEIQLTEGQCAAFHDKVQPISAGARAWYRKHSREQPTLQHLPEGPETRAVRAAEATDSAKKLALANDIDLTAVEGTGSNGRIIKPDVEAAIAAAEESE